MSTNKIASFIQKTCARLLCLALLLGMIPIYTGTVNAAEIKNDAYTAPTLVLAKAQGDVDLLKDIIYDAAQYNLSVTDMGGFTIDTVGDYTVAYLLTRIVPLAAAEP
ncbi:MAG: hypothetical protein RR709_05030, partial [Ruthenibacterium sp.]